MINRNLIDNLVEKSGYSDRRSVYGAIASARKRFNKTITREVAALYLAAQKDIDIIRYGSEEQLKTVREMIEPRSRKPVKPGKINRTVQRSIKVNISNITNGKETLLSPIKFKEAKEMAEIVYPLVYVFENSVRALILTKMKNKYGDNWWDTKVRQGIKDFVIERKQREKEEPWYGKRGGHNIYYTELEHLKGIIFDNWPVFKEIFPRQSWLFERFDTIRNMRNIIAHNNPLDKKNISRIRLEISDWFDLIKEKKHKI